LNIKGLMKNKYIYLVFRLTLGSIFIYASIDKILNPADFAKIVYNYKLLPGFAINIFGIILPWIEFISGLLLIIGFRTQGSAFIISALLVVFIFAISINVIRGVDISCGCFSTSSSHSSKVGLSLLFRDMLMLIMGIYLCMQACNFLSFKAKS
jgi:uncharacterized membrane protein YphA (DoxX/SURF4 family)